MPPRFHIEIAIGARPRHRLRNYLTDPQIFAGNQRHQQPAQADNRVASCACIAGAACHRADSLRGYAGIFDRTYDRALRRIEMPDAFGAFLRIDDVHVVLETNGCVGTFEFAGAANRAL
jgi:hypothetical protein